MKGAHLGEFEEIVLLSIAILKEDAYGIAIKNQIKRRLKRNPSIGALHSAFNRLEEKGFLESYEGETTPDRGGRRRRYYSITKSGAKAVQRVKDLRNEMWDAIGELSVGFKRS